MTMKTNEMNIQDLISGTGFIMVNKGLAKEVGLVSSTIYGELVSTNEYWKNRDKLVEYEGKSWFYCTIDDLEDKTTIKKDAQAKAIKTLEKEGLIISKRFGLPAKRHFHITDKYIRILTDNYFSGKPQTDNDGVSNVFDEKNGDEASHDNSFRENRKLDFGKTATNNKELNKKQTNKTNIKIIDDDKRTSSTTNNDEDINLIISNLKEATKDDMTERSFKGIVRKVVDKYNQNSIGEGKFRDYLVTCLTNKIEELELRRMKDKAKQEISESKKQRISDRLNSQEITNDVPFYDWLNE